MRKRTFLKTAGILATGAAWSGLYSCKPKKKKITRTNWAGNLAYSTDNVFIPNNINEVKKAIDSCKKVRTLGTKHCFNKIADSAYSQISSEKFNQIIELNKEKATVKVGGGIKYGEFVKYLDENGFALYNLASLPHISVAGACATGTHGSGILNGNLPSSVLEIEFVNGSGELVRLSKEKNGEDFALAVVNLGCIGVVTSITLALQPSFKMKQIVYQNLSMSALEKDFEAIMSAGYSVSLFTDWSNKNISEVWIKSKSDDLNEIAPEFFGATIQTKNLHPIESLDALNCTDQMGLEGPWYERMPHFKMGFTPSSGKELQAEYFVDFENAYQAFMAVESLNQKITPHLFITEIRSVAADDLPMSMMYKKRKLAIHFTWKQETLAVLALLPQIEKVLEPFAPIPHWGKLFTLSPKVLQSRYEKLADFKQFIAKHDPKEKFRNDFIDTNLFG